MGLYTTLNQLDNPTIFKYILIIILFIFFFRNKNIGLNVFLAIIIGTIVVLYNYDKRVTIADHIEEEKKVKLESIKPQPRNFKGKTDIVDIVFSIQDFHDYNPLAFEEMIDNIDNFLEIYSILFKEGREWGNLIPLCEQHYQIADSKKNNALNALHSIIFSLPNDPRIIDKLNRAHKRMETVLNKYLNLLYDACHHDLVQKGYHVERKNIYLGPKEANHYFDKDFTYQIY